jgi:iron complex transport system ATP-binding protein
MRVGYMKEILRAENISVGYKEKQVLRDLNLNIEKGKIYSIIGPNGSGKTTLLRTLSRNIKPKKGKIFLDGKNISKIKNKQIARKMAVLSQIHGSNTDVTVRNLVVYGRYAYKEWWKGDSEQDTNIVDLALKTTNMMEFANKKMCNLSGGEKQRAWIAMAIAQKPEILLLDEPTTFLDISHQLEVLELVETLNKENGITILMVLHDINMAARYSDELIVIKNGDIYLQGEPWNIISEKHLKDVFNINGDITEDTESGKPIFFPRLAR